MKRVRPFHLALLAIVVLAFALHLKGIHDPLLDHPGWRQGDTAAIARNFARLDLNPLHPQADYDGPPPNYVELELQIVPFLAASLYKIFGVHEIFGRLLSVAFSIATVGAIGLFARSLLGSPLAGLAAALAFAIMPGSIYYGRTFMPDTAMVFFLTIALDRCARWLIAEPEGDLRALVAAALLTAAAILAKPVAAIALVPILAMMIARHGLRRMVARRQTWLFLAIAFAPYVLYDTYVARIAEWHWASGITREHVIPSLEAALGSPQALGAKWRLFVHALGLIGEMMLGRAETVLTVVAVFVPTVRRARPLLFGWLAAGLLYVFVVMTVEPVDYYGYPLLPMSALWIGALVARLATLLPDRKPIRGLAAACALGGALLVLDANRAVVAGYYFWNPTVWSTARGLDRRLAPDALIVMGHLDPSILYYINRKGWEEDAALWTPFDEQSAIRKGARYFVAVEPGRLARNRDLAVWLARSPIVVRGRWPVYRTDPPRISPPDRDVIRDPP